MNEWKPKITKEELEEYYINQKHTKIETKNYFNVSERILYKHLKYYNIKKNLAIIPTKEELEKLYIQDYLTHENVAKFYGKSREWVRILVRKYQIKIPKEVTQIIRERTNIKKYGSKTPLTNKECIEKGEETNLRIYGCKRAADSSEIRKKAGKRIKESRIKNHTTNKDLMKSNNIYKNGLTRKEYFIKTRRETLYKNNTTGKSKDEKLIFEILSDMFGEVRTQYTSKEYPFNVDFYIPKLNLYIEYQGYWAHGKQNNVIYGPFDKNNENHQKLLNDWQKHAKTSLAYKRAVEVWTIRDPLKRKIAKENNLNWLEFWSIEEIKNWLKEKGTE